MANWKSKVLLKDLHEAYENGDMTVRQIGKALAERLQQNPYHDEIDDIIYELRVVDDIDDYDWCLSVLYDFGDQDHRIWFEAL